jgi:hypothetical protein
VAVTSVRHMLLERLIYVGVRRKRPRLDERSARCPCGQSLHGVMQIMMHPSRFMGRCGSEPSGAYRLGVTSPSARWWGRPVAEARCLKNELLLGAGWSLRIFQPGMKRIQQMFGSTSGIERLTGWTPGNDSRVTGGQGARRCDP